MKFYGADRGAQAGWLLHPAPYRWPDDPIEPGQFAMARAAGYPVTLDPFLARPFSYYDYDGEFASLLFEVRGRGTALLDRAANRGQRSAWQGVPDRGRCRTGGAARWWDRGRPAQDPGPQAGRAERAPRRVPGLRRRRRGGVAQEFPGARVATMDGICGGARHGPRRRPGLRGLRGGLRLRPEPHAGRGQAGGGRRSLCQLSVEERMGCGNGSCNGCAVPVNGGYVRSCIEGPVFPAEVLAW